MLQKELLAEQRALLQPQCLHISVLLFNQENAVALWLEQRRGADNRR